MEVMVEKSGLRIDGMEQSCWANIPSELLREVLIKLEKPESQWPLKRNVIACAGVCRSWRDIMKEIVKTPELCGKITFPISVKQDRGWWSWWRRHASFCARTDGHFCS